MSYISLLFHSAMHHPSNTSAMRGETEFEARTVSDARENTCTGTGSAAGNYRLPSGIVSLDHWLDLNA